VGRRERVQGAVRERAELVEVADDREAPRGRREAVHGLILGNSCYTRQQQYERDREKY
jgi:hypothetical protein